MRLAKSAFLVAVSFFSAAPALAQTQGAVVNATGNVSTAPGLSSMGNIDARAAMSPGASINANLANAPRWGINGSGAPASYGGLTNSSAAALQTPGGVYGGPVVGNGAAISSNYGGGVTGMTPYATSRWSQFAPQASGRSFSNFGGRTFARGYYTMQAPGYGYGIYNNPYAFSATSSNQGLYSGRGVGIQNSGGYFNGFGMNAGAPAGAGMGNNFGSGPGTFVGSTGNVPPQ